MSYETSPPPVENPLGEIKRNPVGDRLTLTFLALIVASMVIFAYRKTLLGTDDPAVGIGVVAVIVAAVTFYAVLQQISLANRALDKAGEQLQKAADQIDISHLQIDLANQQISLAREELEVVKDDLDLSRQVVEDLQRRAKLSLTSLGYEVNVSDGNQFGFTLKISNNGNRSTKSFRLSILLPKGLTVDRDHDEFQRLWRPLVLPGMKVNSDFAGNGVVCRLFDETVYPGESIHLRTLVCRHTPHEPGLYQENAWWRIDHDDGNLPATPWTFYRLSYNFDESQPQEFRSYIVPHNPDGPVQRPAAMSFIANFDMA